MATGFEKTWADIIQLTTKLNKSIPTSSVDVALCDIVSADIFTKHPWFWTLKRIQDSTTVSLSDGVQDYSGPSDMFRVAEARLICTSQTPNIQRELDVVSSIPTDLVPYSWLDIRSIAWQPAAGSSAAAKLRLEHAVQVPSGTTYEIRGTYQPFHTAITSKDTTTFFPAAYWLVGVEGILYWYYKLGDDPRQDNQLIKYMAAIDRMKQAQDFTTIDNMFPAESMGAGEGFSSYNYIFGG